MKKILKFAGAAIALIIVVGLILPRKAHLERSVVIQAPVDRVFSYVNSLSRFQEFSPWREMEPDAAVTMGEKTEGVGASFSWKGKKTGEGSMTISESTKNERVVTDLEFKDQGKATAYFNLKPQDGGTQVTWGFDGDAGYNLISRYFYLFMDRFLGPDYERGLAKLKALAEAAPEKKSPEKK